MNKSKETKDNYPEDKQPSSGLVNAKASSQGITRRQFLLLSSVVVSGGIASVVLDSRLKPLNAAYKATGQLITPRMQGNFGAILVKPVQATSGVTTLNASSIPQFENQLTGPPPVYQPNVVTSNGKVIHEYTVAMSSFSQQMLPASMSLLTTVYGYGSTAIDAITGASLGQVQSSPGPTFEASRGIPIQVKWQNNIASVYSIAVDPTIHWANPDSIPMPSTPFPAFPPGYPSAQSPIPLVTHLHGGENQSYNDGGPNAWFTSSGKHGSAYATYKKTDSNAAVYYYPNTQQPTTLWYHDHALGLTRLNVLSGLAGFYLIRESNTANDKVAPMLPTGKYEMPLVIQDRTFNSDGSLNYPTVGSVPDTHPYWVNTFLGSALIVNGKVWPNMNVDRGQYRLRFLNGSNSRFYSLNFSNGMSFTQIGSDGGYLQTPAQIASVALAPAERADVIVDFSSLSPGQTVTLQNSALITNTSSEAQTVGRVMQFTANDAAGITPFNISDAPKPFNPTLPGSTFPTLPTASKQRVLTLYEIAGSNGSTSEAMLDGQAWSAPISEDPQAGATEEWVIVNPTMDTHPIHLHLIQFQLVQRQSMNASSAYVDEWLKVNGQPPFNHPTINVADLSSYLYTSITSPQPQEQGWKDTIIVNASEVATIRVRFASQDGSSFPFDAGLGPGYVWHCHLLEHEDNEMMRPYIVKTPIQAAAYALPVAVAVTGAGAVALGAAYAHHSKHKVKRAENPVAGSDSFSADTEVSFQEAERSTSRHNVEQEHLK